MSQWQPKVAKNSVMLLRLCKEKGLSREQIIKMVTPIGNAPTVKEKEKTAKQLMLKIDNIIKEWEEKI